MIKKFLTSKAFIGFAMVAAIGLFSVGIATEKVLLVLIGMATEVALTIGAINRKS